MRCGVAHRNHGRRNLKITPHEMLKLLGIVVPQEGITINPNDAYLYTQFLRMLGQRMNVEAIPPCELEGLGAGMEGSLGEAGTQWTSDKLDKLRVSLRLIQTRDFGMTVA